ncbi:MAG: peptide chain release factor N(5)-glutamine methyltransferase [Oscillospiraceae bacterium]|nr:peptide chain release factor N(5)-glutamine methyltransferase [Oscillospiraceae bacterium]
MKTYNDIYMTARNTLRQHGVEACNLEARILLAQASGKSTADLLKDMHLYTTAAVEEKVKEYTARRLRGEPVAYITGTWEFYGLPMIVTPDVLIPRLDTEVLVDTAKSLLIGRKMDARILDLCCGSGCITCALAHELPASKLVAVDISASALEVCRANVTANRFNTRVICMQADATASPPMSIGSFDLIVSNPPYIASPDIMTLDPSVRDYEPIWALDGGEDGLRFYKGIIKYWKSLLRPGGYLLFEVGEGQAQEVKDMLLSAGFASADTRKDTAGTERVVFARTYENGIDNYGAF